MFYKRLFNLMPVPAAAAAAAGGAAAGGSAGLANAANIATIAGASAGGLDAIGAQGLGIASLILQRKANKESMQWQKEMYADQKSYNSPAAQMGRLRAAGLNPYGDYSVTPQTSTPQPVSQYQGLPEILNGMAGNLSKGAANAFNTISQHLAFKQLELQDKQLDYEFKLTDQQIKELQSKTAYQDLMNWILEGTAPSQRHMAEIELSSAMEDLLMKQTQNDWMPKQLKAALDNLIEDTAGKKYNRTKYLPATLLLSKALNQSNIDLNQAQINKLSAEIEDITTRGFAIKDLKQAIDKMPNGIGKAFLLSILSMIQMGFKVPGK